MGLLKNKPTSFWALKLDSVIYGVTQSCCKWPETFQSSWLLCNDNTSRMAAGAGGTTGGASRMRGTTPPGMWPCSKAGLPPHPHHQVLWAGTGQTGGTTLFSGNDKLCWLGESSDLPPAPFPRTTCRVDLFRSKLVWRSVSEPWEPKQPATEDDCNLGSIRELEARGLLLLVFLQPPHCRKGHSIPLREREGDKMAALNYMCNSPGGL